MNGAMIGSISEMQRYIVYLKQLINDLIQSRDAAKSSVKQMKDQGYDDSTFVVFDETFEAESKFIEELNRYLEDCVKFYGISIELLDEHLKEKFKGGFK